MKIRFGGYNLGTLQEKILKHLAEHGSKNINQTKKSLNAHYKSTHEAFKNLEKKKLITRATTIPYRGRDFAGFWLTDLGVAYALLSDINTTRLLSNLRKIYPEKDFLQFFAEIKETMGEKAFQFAFKEALEVKDFSEKSLENFALTVMVHGFLKVRELAPSKTPASLKNGFENVIRKYPSIYEIYGAFKKRTMKELQVLFSDDFGS